MTVHDAQKLLETQKGKYLLVNSIARRVRALQSGSKALVTRHDNDLLATAQEEFRQGKILIKTKESPAEQDEPASPAHKG